MSTTRRDLDRIAEELCVAQPCEYDGAPAIGSPLAQWERDVLAVARALNLTTGLTPNGNRSFDRDRFLRACNVRLVEATGPSGTRTFVGPDADVAAAAWHDGTYTTHREAWAL